MLGDGRDCQQGASTCAPEFSSFSLLAYLKAGFLDCLVKCGCVFHNMVFQHVPASLPIVAPCYQLAFLQKWGKQQEQKAEYPVLTKILILREMSVSVGDAGIAIAAVILSKICMGTALCPWIANELINGSWLFVGIQTE